MSEGHEFIPIGHFEDIIELAKQQVGQKAYQLNFNLKLEYSTELISNIQLHDVATKAEDWQKVEKPDYLHINHGEYITKNGLEHLVEELKIKNDSNRAIVSLINQKDIIGSGDKPIPSFMLLQCGIEGENLYITLYFRALEVINFLRINLEEVRQIAYKICNEILSLSTVKLNIIAFRAYANERQNTLERPDIDLLEESRMTLYMQQNVNKIISLLNQKEQESTVIENSSFRMMYKIINDEEVSKSIHSCFKKQSVINHLDECIRLTDELMRIRTKASHHKDIEKQSNFYLTALGKLIEELEGCL